MTLLLAVLTGLISPASAQQANIDKAEKLFDKSNGTNTKLLNKARAAIDEARVHIDTRDSAATWLLYADIVKTYALDPELKSPWDDATVEALRAYDAAAGKTDAGDFTERILEGVMTLEAQTTQRVLDAYERKAYQEAWDLIRPLMDAQGLVRQLGRLDPGREHMAYQYAVLSAIELGKLGDAQHFHRELDEIGGRKSGTTKALADKLAESDTAKALKFLQRWSDEDPRDATLMEARIDLLLKTGREDDVSKLLDRYEDVRGSAIAITLLHARTLAQLRRMESADEAYQKAKALEPTNNEVLRGHATMLMQWAVVAGREGDSKKERAAAEARASELRQRAIELLEASQKLDPSHLPTLEQLSALYQLTNADAAKQAELKKKIDSLK